MEYTETEKGQTMDVETVSDRSTIAYNSQNGGWTVTREIYTRQVTNRIVVQTSPGIATIQEAEAAAQELQVPFKIAVDDRPRAAEEKSPPEAVETDG